MSKQVKLKFKKLLKKAEFVHADLEYHDELLPEAKLTFADAVSEILATLSEEEKSKIEAHRQDMHNAAVEQLKREHAERERQEAEQLSANVEGVPATSDMLYGEEFPGGIDLAQHDPNIDAPEFKIAELKKLFYKVADLTHPDKSAARGASELESIRLEKLFRRASEAYNNLNWYVLYSIALDLDISVDDPTEDNLEWLENDIRLTMGKIAQVGNLIVWMWYTGNEMTKNMAIANYLKQVFDHEWKPPPID
tara:strand:- start:585 stop:1337 length:753 start_codon:yes stop_codon:yes gene_type:complete